MPLPPLDPSNTERWFYKYSSGGFFHTIMMRTVDGITREAVVGAYADFLTAISDAFYLCTTISLDRADRGSNIRLPQSLDDLPGSFGALNPAPVDSPYALAFPGRSVAGRKARVYLVGTKLKGDANYRYGYAENAAVAAGIDSLNTNGADMWLGIDGQPCNWYQYATAKQNDHFIGRLRGT